MFIKQNRLFSRLVGWRDAKIVCDVCGGVNESLGADISKFDTYSSSAEKIDLMCDQCYSKGLKNYRYDDVAEYRSHNRTAKDFDCCICRKSLSLIRTEEINAKAKYVCAQCWKFSAHPDNSHAYQSGHYFYEAGEYTSLWDDCVMCGTLRTQFQKRAYAYYRPGAEFPSFDPIRCQPGSTHKYSCSHIYVCLADLTVKDAKRVEQSDLSRANASLKQNVPFLRDDPYSVVSMDSLRISREGYFLLWCKKCGDIEKKVLD